MEITLSLTREEIASAIVMIADEIVTCEAIANHANITQQDKAKMESHVTSMRSFAHKFYNAVGYQPKG